MPFPRSVLPAMRSMQSMKMFHTTRASKGIDESIKAVGAGLGLIGMTGPGIGVGYVFGNLISASARNPSIAKQLFGNAVMGAAFCEGLGLFLLVMAFIILM